MTHRARLALVGSYAVTGVATHLCLVGTAFSLTGPATWLCMLAWPLLLALIALKALVQVWLLAIVLGIFGIVAARAWRDRQRPEPIPTTPVYPRIRFGHYELAPAAPDAFYDFDGIFVVRMPSCRETPTA